MLVRFQGIDGDDQDRRHDRTGEEYGNEMKSEIYLAYGTKEDGRDEQEGWHEDWNAGDPWYFHTGVLAASDSWSEGGAVHRYHDHWRYV